ncbi:MAG: IPExxxVDY family protein [Bacteroidales bacterium]|nr:IPExxxVDY family protein [Bacteroidales bacterium]MDD3891448.1 IPExxxVDY family protein [Bacteroidales bacterium]
MAKRKILLNVPKEKSWFFAISSAETIHKLAWSINSTLNLNLSEQEGITKGAVLFPILFDDQTNPDFSIGIAKNRVDNQILIKGLENIDYILVIKGNTTDKETSKLIGELKGINNIIAIIAISQQKIKDLSLLENI